MRRSSTIDQGKPAIRVMMDSGAFSAWVSGVVINFDDYVDYLKLNREYFHLMVGLDVIPGKKKSMSGVTPAMLKETAEGSYANFVKMRKAGIEAIPVFHQGEDFKYLERYLDDRVPYLGIATYKGGTNQSMLRWLDKCFSVISTRDGIPVTKTHGFGITSSLFVQRYPWTTVDSTAWIKRAAYGGIYLPTIDHGIPRFDLPPNTYAASDREKVPKGLRDMAVLNMGPTKKKRIEDYLAGIDLNISEVCASQAARSEVNLAYFLGLQKSIGVRPFQHRDRSIKPRANSTIIQPFDYSPEIYFATTMRSTWQVVALNRLRASNRLVNYFDCRTLNGPDIHRNCAKVAIKLRDQKIWSGDYKLFRRRALMSRYPNQQLEFNGVEDHDRT